MVNAFLTLSALILFILLYFIMAQFFNHRRFNYLQQTSIAIVVGVVVGVFISSFTDFFDQNSLDPQNFIRDMIILILLPPIMFEDGYNFPRRKFFQNILYINLYGLLGTLLNYLIIWGMLYAFNNAQLFVSISDIGQGITLYNWQILLIAAALSSIEPVVTQKVVDKQRYPKLFSIVFGQSLFKDTLAVTFFDAIRDMVADSKDVSYDIVGQDIGFLILRFLEVVVCSILIGVVAGLLLTIMFKNWRFLVKEKGISQMALTILTAFLTYVLSEWAGLSGVISMLFCGTVLAHYNSYNLTPEGKSVTIVTIQVLKIAASGVIFFFIGFEIFNIPSFESAVDGNAKSTFSGSLLGLTFVSLLVGRTVNVFLVSGFGWLLTKRQNWRLNVYEYFIIFLAGLVHGAVPFALSVTIPFLQIALPTSNCAQLNIIAVVLVTSLLFNILIPKVQKVLLSRIREMEKNQRDHPSVKESFGERKRLASHKTAEDIIADANTPLLNRFKSTTQKYWRKFQEGVLKPFLIFDYRERRQHIKMEKVRQRIEEHRKYMERYEEKENFLNGENQEENKFIEIKHSENSGTSEEEGGVFKVRLGKDKYLKKKKVRSQKGAKGKHKNQAFPEKDSENLQNSLPRDYSDHIKSEKTPSRKLIMRSEDEKRRPTETQIVSISSKKMHRQGQQGPIELNIQQIRMVRNKAFNGDEV